MARSDPESALQALLRERPDFSSRDLAERLGISRQAVHHHLTRWLEQGRLERTGTGRGTRYRRAASQPFRRTYPTAGLEEHRAWQDVRAVLPELDDPECTPASAVLEYAATELLNNAIEHSRSTHVSIDIQHRDRTVEVEVSDEGMGAFENVRAAMDLPNHLSALQEISKGKVTTRPRGHTGESLFFTSKMCRQFELRSNGLAWVVDNDRADQTILAIPEGPGTLGRVEHPLDSTTTPEQVFALYTHELKFDTTRCVIKLFEHGLRFVSRSEAKRLLHGLEKFREVILDFKGVEGVGQGFADEVFRVWAQAHPEVRLVAEAMAPPVEFMVGRARAGS